jgi:hypothetical protein
VRSQRRLKGHAASRRTKTQSKRATRRGEDLEEGIDSTGLGVALEASGMRQMENQEGIKVAWTTTG